MSAVECVVLSGGGAKGIGELGALHYFYERGIYVPEKVDTYVGTSIGSAICLLLICGYTPMEIFHITYTLPSFLSSDKQHNIWDLIKNFGIMSIDGFMDKIGELVKAKMNGVIPSMQELKKITGKRYIVAVANISKMQAEYMTAESNPNISCLDPARMSCSLPFVFHRIRYNGDYYGDGGIVDNFPIRYVDDGRKKILGIVVTGIDKSMSAESFFGYIYHLLVTPIYATTQLRCENLGDNCTVVSMNFDGYPLLEFSMDDTKKMNMFMSGYRQAEQKEHTKNLYVQGWSWVIDPIDDIAAAKAWGLDWDLEK
jgi:predicted acylesterase/phospholipase RssA